MVRRGTVMNGGAALLLDPATVGGAPLEPAAGHGSIAGIPAGRGHEAFVPGPVARKQGGNVPQHDRVFPPPRGEDLAVWRKGERADPAFGRAEDFLPPG